MSYIDQAMGRWINSWNGGREGERWVSSHDSETSSLRYFLAKVSFLRSYTLLSLSLFFSALEIFMPGERNNSKIGLKIQFIFKKWTRAIVKGWGNFSGTPIIRKRPYGDWGPGNWFSCSPQAQVQRPISFCQSGALHYYNGHVAEATCPRHIEEMNVLLYYTTEI